MKTNLKSVSYCFHIVLRYEKSRGAHGMCLCECICVCVSVWGWWVMSGFADFNGLNHPDLTKALKVFCLLTGQ